jgi:hypothetical protein
MAASTPIQFGTPAAAAVPPCDSSARVAVTCALAQSFVLSTRNTAWGAAADVLFAISSSCSLPISCRPLHARCRANLDRRRSAGDRVSDTSIVSSSVELALRNTWCSVRAGSISPQSASGFRGRSPARSQMKFPPRLYGFLLIQVSQRNQRPSCAASDSDGPAQREEPARPRAAARRNGRSSTGAPPRAPGFPRQPTLSAGTRLRG